MISYGHHILKILVGTRPPLHKRAVSSAIQGQFRMTGDLEGILVVSLEQAIAAPFASCRLAMAGARVIKVERREGDFARRYDRYALGQSAYFSWLNHGKEAMTVGLRDAADRDLLLRMLERADVFIQNLSPGAVERYGLGDEELVRRNPRLVTCSISGYGAEGPYRDMKAYDLLVQAESGLCSVTGTAEAEARVGISIVDIATGMYAYQAILQALHARHRTGRGRPIRISMFDCIADWMNVPYLQWAYGGYAQERTGLHHPTITPYGAYRCADGTLFVAVQNEGEWERFCAEVLLRPGMAKDARFATTTLRAANRATLDSEITAIFRDLPRDTLIQRCEAGRIAYARMNGLPELAEHPQARFMDVMLAEGPLRMLVPPGTPAGTTIPARRVPSVGEHDEPIRREFAPVKSSQPEDALT